MHLNWLAKNELKGLGGMVVKIIVNYLCAQKNAKEPETEQTIVFCHIFIIGGILS